MNITEVIHALEQQRDHIDTAIESLRHVVSLGGTTGIAAGRVRARGGVAANPDRSAAMRAAWEKRKQREQQAVAPAPQAPAHAPEQAKAEAPKAETPAEPKPPKPEEHKAAKGGKAH